MAEAQRKANAKKAQALADELFPDEKWLDELNGVPLGDSIRVASSALQTKNIHTVEKELKQAQLLSVLDAVTYILPDSPVGDAIVNGIGMEFKTITGSFSKIERRFRKSTKQNLNVFMYLNPDKGEYEIARIRQKIGQILIEKNKKEGQIIVWNKNKFYFWDVKDFL